MAHAPGRISTSRRARRNFMVFAQISPGQPVSVLGRAPRGDGVMFVRDLGPAENATRLWRVIRIDGRT
jgi:hypothetical protein